MELEALLAELKKRRIKIWAENGKLRYEAPKGAVDKELLGNMSQRKAELLTSIHQAQSARSRDDVIPKTDRSPGSVLPLSFAQERLWFLNQLEPDNPFYNVPSVLRLRGPLREELVTETLNAIVARHECLRTRYESEDGRPRQIVKESARVVVARRDVSAEPAAEREERLKELAYAETNTPFDLTAAPMLRALLIFAGEDDWVLVLVIHHIAADGWSMGVLREEFSAVYSALAEGRENPLEPLRIQYADFAAWQNSWFTGEVLELQSKFWRELLAGAPPALDLPADRPRPAEQSFRGQTEHFEFEPDLAESIQRLTQETQGTLFMTLITAFASLLHRCAGVDDLVIGAPIANRTRRELEPLIGFFVNSLPLRFRFDGQPTFREMLDRVREMSLQAFDHQDIPFERLVEELKLERDLSRNPLFQVMFAVQNSPGREASLAGLTVEPLQADIASAQFDVVVDIWRSAGRLRGTWEYSTDLFDRETVRRSIHHFVAICRALVTEPDRRIIDVDFLDPEEVAEIARMGQGPRRDYPNDRTLPALFEAQAADTPERTAIAHNDGSLTYRELNRAANRLARRLRTLRVQRNELVGIVEERGVDSLVCMLGILKAGGAFVPLDPSYPRERLKWMLADSRTRVLLSRRSALERLGIAAAELPVRELLLLDDEPVLPPEAAGNIHQHLLADWSGESADNLEPVNEPTDVAYALYTSGSTGVPKGALVRHNGAVNHIFGEFELMRFHSDSVFLQSAPSSSDISVWQFLAPGLIGGRVEVADFETVCDPTRLLALIRSAGVTVIELVPSVMAELLNHAGRLSPEERATPALEWSMVTGEAVSPGLVQRWFEIFPEVPLVNAYGPTEAADDICQHAMTEALPSEAVNVPIGRPLPNLSLHVLDGQLKRVPLGVVGEICVAGIGVGQGYWRNEKQTRKSFVSNPYAEGERDQTLYRTGDLGRWRPDGALEFLERTDSQVKLRGFRIELGEIEAALSRNPAVLENVVEVREDDSGDKCLVAYLRANRAAEARGAAADDLEKEQVRLWEDLHENSYRQSLLRGDVTFNVIGWDSNYTNQPLPESDMREYVDHTVGRIVAQNPRNVLEIGCGTGLILFALLPHCREYRATDLSSVAINQLRDLQSRADLQARIAGLERAELLPREALDFTGVEPGRFDTVIFPSVVQYFPSVNYLLEVLDGVFERLASGGRVFLGDIRHKGLLEAFHATVQLAKAEPKTNRDELADRVRRQVESEQELALHPDFFRALVNRHPSIARVEIQPKRGRGLNEMTRFRYDVILHTETPKEKTTPVLADWDTAPLTLEEIETLLRDEAPEIWGLRAAPNARVKSALRMAGELKEGLSDAAPDIPETWRSWAEPDGACLEPEDLIELGAEIGYRVELSLSAGDAFDTFDVVFIDRQRRPDSLAVDFAHRPASRSWQEWGNHPLGEKLNRALSPELRDYLKARLPAHMIPSVFVFLDSFPLNPAGKVDRARLPSPDHSRLNGDGFVAPEGKIEEGLAEIWRETLGLEEIGAQTNFFEAGGHSLKATQIISRVEKRFGADLSVREIFNRPTIRELAEAIHPGGDPIDCEIKATPRQQHYELSNAQRRLWALCHIDNVSVAYNMAECLRLRGAFDRGAFERALTILAERHESLRTSFALVDDVPRQFVADQIDLPISYDEVTTVDDPEAACRNLVRHEALEPLDLAKPPLWRVRLVKLAEDDRVMLFTIHHIVSDGWSMGVLTREFSEYYAALRQGSPPMVEPLRIQYRDFAAWQNARLQEAEGGRMRDYWHRKLSGDIAPLRLPTDAPRPPVKSYAGSGHSAVWSGGDLRRLREFCRRRRVTLYTALATALKALFHRYTVQEDICIGCPMAGREDVDLERQVGFYINTVVLRDQVSGDQSFAELLKAVSVTISEAFDAGEYPFDRLVGELNLRRDVSRTPLFDVMLAVQNTDNPELDLPDLKVSSFDDQLFTSQFDLNFKFEERGDTLHLDLDYNTDLFVESTVVRMAEHLRRTLNAMVAAPDQSIAQADFITEEERLAEKGWNATEAIYPQDACLSALITEQARQTPDSVAVLEGDLRMSYAELEAHSERVAVGLAQAGAPVDGLVGVLLPRSAAVVPALLGIMKAGAGYLPIGPDLPDDRIAFMLEDSGVRLILTNRDFRDRRAALLQSAERVVCLEDLEDAATDGGTSLPAVRPEHLAYCIYTSGSTGKPKGTLVEHRNVVRLIRNSRFQFEVGSRDIWTWFHSYAFDFSVWEIWGALCHGGTVDVVSGELARDPASFVGHLDRAGVTVLNQTPSAFYELSRAALDRPETRLAELRYVIFGGEGLDYSRLADWRERFPHVRLVNMYGITETTVHVTFKEIGDADVKAGLSNIGRPIPTTTLHVLDEAGNTCPIGVPGELCVGGEGVSRGYLNRPELNARKFVEDPFRGQGRLYRSGDLGRRLPNGEIEFLGRMDDQIQIRGYRVETGEIAAVLERHADVREAIVVPGVRSGSTQLWAYLIPERHAKPDAAQLRAFARRWLPEYMLPSAFVELAAFPLTVNGKLDRKALPAPGETPSDASPAMLAPDTDLQQALWDIWRDILGHHEFGVDDNFFDQGGDSLTLVRVQRQIQESLGREVPMVELFQFPTIDALAEHLDAGADEPEPLREDGGRARLTREARRQRQSRRTER